MGISRRHRRFRPPIVLAVAGVGSVLLATGWVVTAPGAVGIRAVLSGESACGLRAALGAGELHRRQREHAWSLTQATRRLATEGGQVLFDTPAGRWWAPETNASGLQFGLAEHDRRPYGLPQAGDVVLDVGANVGLFTRAALEAGASVVVAVEPVPANVESLRRNFAEEIAKGRVIVHGEGAWDRSDTLEMYVYDESQLDSFTMGERPEAARPPRRVSLPVATIDSIVSRLGLPRVDFVKMDIEGAEARALAGASRTLRRFAPRLAIATENLPDDPVTIPHLVAEIVPAYRAEQGACILLENGSIAPEVVFFRRAA